MDDPGVRGLFDAADAYGLSIYAHENYHALDVREFARKDVVLLVARSDAGEAIGMVALNVPTAEIKRMFVAPEARGTGLGRRLLEAVEAAARDRGIPILRLETGEPQTAAVALYEAAGYRRIPAFGEYVDDPTSVCMQKPL
ncbi:MAG: GNAT family N-acetyltransferase [Pseudolysinimonas sp.]